MRRNSERSGSTSHSPSATSTTSRRRLRARLHRAVFEALRPGGIYGVVDHTRRHMEPDTPENRRRLDPVVAMEEILAAGFAFEAWSDLHRRPGDDLRLEVGHPDVTGATDRFTFRFRKPEAPPPDEETP